MHNFNASDIEPSLAKKIAKQKLELTDGIGKMSNHKLLKVYVKLFEKEDIDTIKEIAKNIDEKL